MNNLGKAINDTENVSVTENGAIGYRTTGKALLDLNFSVSSMRQMDEETITNKFEKAFDENPNLALKWLFYARDVREGIGERRLFRVIARQFAHVISEEIVPLIPEFGRWDDLYCFFGTVLEDRALECICDQFTEDNYIMLTGSPISLLAKWLPSINTSSAETRRNARKIARYLELSDKEYRVTLAEMRKYLNIVERHMSDNRWQDIEYPKVPSKANLLYGNAFARHDADRRAEYLAQLSKGETKINSGTLFPHEIVSKVRHDGAIDYNLMDELWKALPNKCTKDTRTLVVADSSGSMCSKISTKGNAQAMDVSMALAFYFSEKLKGEFANKFVTFSTCPRFVDIGKCKTISEKIGVFSRHCEVSDTNIEAVFDLVLCTAVKGNLKQEDLPDNILIISDMEFNRCSVTSSFDAVEPKLFEVISARFNAHGYKLPKLIFWNVLSRTGTIPVKENEMGVTLVSGFSTNILKLVMSDILDPYEALVTQLMSERYEDINYCK